SSDDNKGVSIEGPSITSIAKEGPSTARRSKEPIPKELLEWYGYDTVKDYLPVAKKLIPKVIFKSLIPIKGCVSRLANVETWDNICCSQDIGSTTLNNKVIVTLMQTSSARASLSLSSRNLSSLAVRK
nr:hypothetical protein [Tanacetum cinerariifolium]